VNEYYRPENARVRAFIKAKRFNKDIYRSSYLEAKNYKVLVELYIHCYILFD